MKMLTVPLLLVLLVCGCAGRNFDMAQVDRVGSKEEALKCLGEPRTKAKNVNMGYETWGYSFGTPFGAKAAFITFDKDGNVVGRTSSK